MDQQLPKPADLLLHYNYGAVAVKQWGKNTSVLSNGPGIPHPSVPELVPLAPRRGKNKQGARSERNISKGAAADLLGGPGQLG